MNDYVTRAEFEELKEMLMCRGDGQSIEVDSTPGGQIIRSVGLISNEPGDSVKDYMTVSYDSELEIFSVKFENMPFKALKTFKVSGGNEGVIPGSVQLFPSGYSPIGNLTYKFAKPTTTNQILFYLAPLNTGIFNGNWCVKWYSSTATSTDAATLAKETTGDDIGTNIASLVISNDGSYTKISSPTSEMEIITGDVKPHPFAIASFNRVKIFGLMNDNTRQLYNLSCDTTLPVDDYLILCWNNGGESYLLDVEANAGDYDDHQRIGRVIIDASGNVNELYLYDNNALQLTTGLGYTGTHVIGETTIEIKNGKILNVI